MKLKVNYFLQTPWPTDVDNPVEFEALDWSQSGTIPFLPTVGMHLCIDGDFRRVEDVYWMADKPNEIDVHFRGDDVARSLNYWTRGGWKTQDLEWADAGRQ